MSTVRRRVFSLLTLTQNSNFIPKSHLTVPSSQPIYSKPDDQMLFRILESCKLFPNLRTAVAVHNKIIKHGYGMYPSLLSLLVSVYVSCEQINLAHQLLGEICFLDFDVVSANMVITSFMKIGEIDIAKKVFSAIPARDVITWNSTIGGYVKNGFFKDAIDIFKEMLRKNIDPDGFTFASVITACARLGALNHAKWSNLVVRLAFAIKFKSSDAKSEGEISLLLAPCQLHNIADIT
ncbi:unnamed protein product [Fraxinus pennsylvanica]|uniref:Pentatricopeptide repeat-containing protein n=1 Tax=Fraxinus pennsylvanica TaxID=56036 RepID=A0AAD2AEG9_9LAMI|nr:unnamed protein product [Fraxinus pennsylvanica]